MGVASTQQLVIVAGDSSDMGKDAVAYYRNKGFEVIGFSRSSSDLKLDVVGSRNLEPLAGRVRATGKEIGLIINFLGGYQGSGTATTLGPEEIESTFATNVLSLFKLARSLQSFLASDCLWINTSSLMAISPSKFNPHYSASKAALEVASKALALEWQDRAIKVLTLRLGPVDTATLRKDQYFSEEKALEKYHLKKLPTPKDIIELIASISISEKFSSGEIVDFSGEQQITR
jgi:NAD(P)-dependent dehydrogenase (short-subunit alcohol dehydrogenase family)